MSNSIATIIAIKCNQSADTSYPIHVGTALFDTAAIITLVVVATLGFFHMGHLASLTHQTAYILYGSAGGVVIFDLAGLAFRKLRTENKSAAIKPNALEQSPTFWNQLDQQTKSDLVSEIIDNHPQGTKKISVGQNTIDINAIKPNALEQSPTFWNQLDLQTKSDLVSEIIDNHPQGTKKISVGQNTIDINYQYKSSGTAADVYIISVGNEKFALKILRSNNLGESAIQLQGHSIKGIVPLRAAETLDIKGEERAIIIMDVLEDTWNDWQFKASDLIFGLNCIKQIIEALIRLEEKGFLHGNIAGPNIMFDKQGNIYVVDIDSVPPATDEYAEYKRRTDMRNIKSLLLNLVSKCCQKKHPLFSYCYSEVPNSLELFKDEIESLILVNKCMELYKNGADAWVKIPPQMELQKGEQPVIAIGTASYEGAGDFKIHISVDPTQMEQAIPIVLEILYRKGSPTVGLKFQTGCMLSGVHQVGKEFALIFGSDAEQGEESSHAIEKLLSQIQAAFIKKGINPEKGLILTAATREEIEKLPEGQQPMEKRNLEQRKFDRPVPGSTYFYYRHEAFTALDDSDGLAVEMGTQERKANKMILFSEIDQVLSKNPENAHNPLGVKDPFRNLRIS